MADKDEILRTFGSVFTSPRLLSVFSSSKGFSESDSVKSPTSILDNKPFSGFGNPFWSDNKNPSSKSSSTDPFFLEINKQHPWEKKLDSAGVGLGIVDALNDEEHNQKFSNSSTSTRMVLFGSQLKIQIPPAAALESSLKSPTDFGIKTRVAQLGKSPCGSANSGFETTSIASPTRVFTGCLSASEMECSEDYTCVITHGPNPRTTHIFDNCIVENCCGVVGFSTSKKETSSPTTKRSSNYPSENLSFLSFCHTCNKDLDQGKDIYIYRGEKAFCSHECRNQEILIDEQIEKSGLENCSVGTGF